MSSGTSKKKLLRFCHSDCLRQLPLVALWRSSDWNKWWLCQWLTELQLTFFCFLWKHFYSEAVEIRRRCCNSYIYAIYCKSFFPRIFFNDFGAILKYFGVSLIFFSRISLNIIIYHLTINSFVNRTFYIMDFIFCRSFHPFHNMMNFVAFASNQPCTI